MTNSPYAKSALAQAALELAPPLIRETLLKESDFRKEYGFRADAVLAFGDSGVSIQRHELFEAIRKILSGAPEMEVTGTDGRKWTLNNDTKIGEQPTLAISNGRQGLVYLTLLHFPRIETNACMLLMRPLLMSICPPAQEMRGTMYFQNEPLKMKKLTSLIVIFAIRRFMADDQYVARS